MYLRNNILLIILCGASGRQDIKLAAGALHQASVDDELALLYAFVYPGTALY